MSLGGLACSAHHAKRLRTRPSGLCGFTSAFALSRLVLALTDPASAGPTVDRRVPAGGVSLAAFEAVAFITLAAIGAVVASRHPRNAVGWFMCSTPLLLATGNLAERAYWSATIADPAARSGASVLLWVDNWIWIPALVPALTVIPLLFPTGSPPTPRWRAAAWAAAAGGVAIFLGFAFTPGPLDNYTFVDNPMGAPEALKGAFQALTAIGFLVTAAAVVSAAASLVLRFRRSHGVEREQLKWVAVASAIAGVVWGSMATLGQVLADPGVKGSVDIGWVMVVLGLLVIAAAVGSAMLRYRLYDIDVVVNRTLVYGALTATLAVAYLGSVLMLQLALSPVTNGSSFAVAASTLAVAALFRPARARIQQSVDRRFFRRKFDAAQTLAAFGGRLRDEVDLATLNTELRA